MEPFAIWQTAETPFYFTANGKDDYTVIQAVRKPATAKYIGFGEQGGQSLSKNTDQVNYFNFDNMRYRQVYNQGPLDAREPLYHSDSFLSLTALPTKTASMPSSLITLASCLLVLAVSIPASSFTAIVGKSRLKPRYCLGYHQSCYGYENRSSLEWAVSKYREHQIPLDGLHVDVDIQHNYQTFTIYQGRFPNPQEMFHNLREQGIKRSTNITPVISREDAAYSTYIQARDGKYYLMRVRN